MPHDTPLDPLDILQRLDWPESNDLEFKAARGGLPKSLWETYCAMANSNGGIILLGVEDDGRVTGVPDAKALKKSFWDTVNNRNKVSCNLLTDADVQEIEHVDGMLLSIRVPRATRYQRPVFLGSNPLTGTYRRNDEGDFHCTEQEVGRMLADRAEEPADSRILEHFGLGDLDRASLQQYRQRFASHKPTHPWLGEDDVGLLRKLGGWRRDRASGREGLTLAGLLMFGTHDALFEALPQYQVDYREYLSEDPDERWSHRDYPDGTWEPNLLQFFLLTILRLPRNLDLPFKLGDDLLRKGETAVHEAIREALVNALIHADYQGVGGVVVEKRADRLVFSNPGTLLVSPEQLMRGSISECRNKALQTMFLMIGAAEKAGSGMDRIRSGWESQHWRQPLMQEQSRPDRIRWELPMISLLPESSEARLRQLFGAQFEACSKAEVQALVTADLENTVDNLRLQQITGIHSRDVTLLLQALVARGMLDQEGRGRWTRYRLPDAMPGNESPVHKNGNRAHNGTGNPVHKAGNPLHNETSPVHKESVDALELIAQPARNRLRLPPKDMEAIILKLCTGRWLTRRKIADLLQRDPDGLRARFLTPMVEHGLLRMRYPESRSRPDQAYTTSEVAGES